MGWFLYVMSILWVVFGTVSILYTDWLREFLKEHLENKNPRFLSPIPLVLGILLVISAGWSEIFWLVFLLGLLAVAKGLYLLVGPRGQIDMVVAWWSGEASERLYRFSGIIALVLGIALLSWIR
ncbi:MAG: hypothetical protein GTN81_07435 [Proteobacteria bacterium]|nr:hypothetical protein [Pseudomonadota bacterium]